jgi:hypothetical protein
MARTGQADFFEDDAQPDLFGGVAAPVYRPDLGKVRARLQKILAEARAAQAMPWQPTQLSLYQTIFPQMTGFLPKDEGAQLRFSFEEEMNRLQAA